MRGHTEAPYLPGDLIGDYYLGDHLGLNISLTIDPDSSYWAVWEGCLGTYAYDEGCWTVVDTALVLTSTRDSSMLRPVLDTLLIQRFRGYWILVPADSAYFQFYFDYGVCDPTCFQPSGCWPDERDLPDDADLPYYQ